LGLVGLAIGSAIATASLINDEPKGIYLFSWVPIILGALRVALGLYRRVIISKNTTEGWPWAGISAVMVIAALGLGSLAATREGAEPPPSMWSSNGFKVPSPYPRLRLLSTRS
jgi:hypothetical protein